MWTFALYSTVYFVKSVMREHLLHGIEGAVASSHADDGAERAGAEQLVDGEVADPFGGLALLVEALEFEAHRLAVHVLFQYK